MDCFRHEECSTFSWMASSETEMQLVYTYRHMKMHFLSMCVYAGAVSVYCHMLEDEVIPDGMTFHLASRAHAMLVRTPPLLPW